MKKCMNLIIISLVALTLTACNQDKQAAAKAEVPAQPAPTEQATAPAPTPAQPAGNVSGTVAETMNAGGYTYVLVDDGKQKIWAAAPEFKVAVGDSVVVPQGMAMQNFHSKSLDRDFDVVYFVESVLNASNPAVAANTPAAMPSGHPEVKTPETPAGVDLTGIAKAEGGQTVGELYSDKANLSGKKVVLRGKVVKFLPQIMGKNWLHIQDGTGDSKTGSNDLTITTSSTANVGDTVLVTGNLTLDKDYGYNYKYDLIIEDAQVAVE